LAVQPPTFREAIRATLLGFHPSHTTEEQYASWMAEKCNLWINAWNVLFLFWVLGCIVRSAKEGSQAFWGHLPAHALHLLPLITTAGITACKQYR
jgi:hypothetical protein